MQRGGVGHDWTLVAYAVCRLCKRICLNLCSFIFTAIHQNRPKIATPFSLFLFEGGIRTDVV